MTEAPQIRCRCGQFQAHLNDTGLGSANHGICYCIDCQAFARHLGQADRILDDKGGSELVQVQTWQITIREGAEHLAVLKLSSKGLYRWYARCCDTPLINTVGNPKIAFAGILAANLTLPKGALGPINFRYKTEHALAPVTEPKGSIVKFILRTVRNIATSRINGRWKKTPFFDITTGRSIVKPYTLNEEERARAYLAE